MPISFKKEIQAEHQMCLILSISYKRSYKKPLSLPSNENSKTTESAFIIVLVFSLRQCHCFSRRAAPVVWGTGTNKFSESKSWYEFVKLNGVVEACLMSMNFLFVTSA